MRILFRMKYKVTYQKYCQQHLLNVDIHFAQNMEYPFCAQYISDIKQRQGDTYLAIYLSHGRTLDGHDNSRNVTKPHCTLAACTNRTSIQVFKEH